jgi:lauroyl/myristoyl acyltransferase
MARALRLREASGDPRRITDKRSANTHLARLNLLRCHRPPQWQPRIRLEGADHVAAAIAAGRGAILWVAPMVFSDLMTKLACHRVGFRVFHLSRDGHGYSPTRFGARFLNPICTTVENRYLAERLTMSPRNSAGALRALVQRVRRNEVVSVTVGIQGRTGVAVPFLDGTITLAGAVPSLALRTGAALLPVFTVKQRDGSYLTVIDPPLGDTGSDDRERVARLVAREAELLASWASRYPAQFVQWDLVQLNESGAAAAAR